MPEYSTIEKTISSIITRMLESRVDIETQMITIEQTIVKLFQRNKTKLKEAYQLFLKAKINIETAERHEVYLKENSPYPEENGDLSTEWLEQLAQYNARLTKTTLILRKVLAALGLDYEIKNFIKAEIDNVVSQIERNQLLLNQSFLSFTQTYEVERMFSRTR